jgi:hypothetical protein
MSPQRATERDPTSAEQADSRKGRRWVLLFVFILLLLLGLPLVAITVSLTRGVDRIYGTRVVRISPAPAGGAVSIDGWDDSPFPSRGTTVRVQRIRVGGVALEYRWSHRR